MPHISFICSFHSAAGAGLTGRRRVLLHPPGWTVWCKSHPVENAHGAKLLYLFMHLEPLLGPAQVAAGPQPRLLFFSEDLFAFIFLTSESRTRVRQTKLICIAWARGPKQPQFTFFVVVFRDSFQYSFQGRKIMFLQSEHRLRGRYIAQGTRGSAAETRRLAWNC